MLHSIRSEIGKKRKSAFDALLKKKITHLEHFFLLLLLLSEFIV